MPVDDTPGALAERLRAARLAAGWSQRELAERAGLHQPQVVRAERGEDLLVSQLVRLAAPLGLSPLLVRTDAQTAVGPATPDPPRDEAIEGWRSEWPMVNPQVFVVLARLARAGRQVEDATRKTAALHGMNGSEIRVLGALRRMGAPYESTPTGLRQRLYLSLPGLKKQLDHLETLGMVTRVGNPQDRRGLVVRLTERGHAALNDLITHPQATVYRALLDMPAVERDALSSLLRSLLERIGPDGEGLSRLARLPPELDYPG